MSKKANLWSFAAHGGKNDYLRRTAPLERFWWQEKFMIHKTSCVIERTRNLQRFFIARSALIPTAKANQTRIMNIMFGKQTENMNIFEISICRNLTATSRRWKYSTVTSKLEVLTENRRVLTEEETDCHKIIWDCRRVPTTSLLFQYYCNLTERLFISGLGVIFLLSSNINSKFYQHPRTG